MEPRKTKHAIPKDIIGDDDSYEGLLKHMGVQVLAFENFDTNSPYQKGDVWLALIKKKDEAIGWAYGEYGEDEFADVLERVLDNIEYCYTPKPDGSYSVKPGKEEDLEKYKKQLQELGEYHTGELISQEDMLNIARGGDWDIDLDAATKFIITQWDQHNKVKTAPESSPVKKPKTP